MDAGSRIAGTSFLLETGGENHFAASAPARISFHNEAAVAALSGNFLQGLRPQRHPLTMPPLSVLRREPDKTSHDANFRYDHGSITVVDDVNRSQAVMVRYNEAPIGTLIVVVF